MDTIVAPITPLIQSSVITIRISGKNVLDILSFLRTSSNEVLSECLPRQVVYGSFVRADGSLIDNVIFYYFKGPHSYTGEDVIEISFHGNPLIVREALALLYRKGIRAAEPGEFTKRAFLNGKIDLTQAEAVSDIISAKSDKGLFYAFNNLKGGLKSQIHSIRDGLMNIAAIVEAYIDFPEEDIGTAEYEMIQRHLCTMEEQCGLLIQSYDYGKSCNDAIDIAIVGKPNSGKSSLLNALVQKSRSIVSDIPGTTRDYIEEEIYISGVPVNIIDTAGIRQTSDSVESIGVDLAIEKVSVADIVLVLIDMASDLTDDDQYILKITSEMNRLVVGNKSDLTILNHIETDLLISAKELSNLSQLYDLIQKKVARFDSDVFQTDVTVTERHKILLEHMQQVIHHLRSDFNDMSLDLISMDINMCLNDLSEITGETYTEEVLDIIFNKFCIGK